MIPKRDTDGFPDWETECDYYKAVAKRAVEALRGVSSNLNLCGSPNRAVDDISQALSDIEASGWKD